MRARRAAGVPHDELWWPQGEPAAITTLLSQYHPMRDPALRVNLSIALQAGFQPSGSWEISRVLGDQVTM